MMKNARPETTRWAIFPRALLVSRLVDYSLIIGLAVVWQLAGWLKLLPDYLLPPLAILGRFFAMTFSGELVEHVAASLFRSMSGFALGAMLGLIFGLLAGVLRWVETFWDPLISLTYPVPKVALLPVLLVWFGIGDTSKIVVIALACFYPVFLNAYYGARGVNERYIWAARAMGANSWQIFIKVIFPAALGSIFTGLRLALALSFVVLFSAELLGGKPGLGYLIVQAEQGLRFDIMYVSILTITLLGFTADRLLLLLRRHWLAGQELAQYGEG